MWKFFECELSACSSVKMSALLPVDEKEPI